MPGSANAGESTTRAPTDEYDSRFQIAWHIARRHATGRRLCLVAAAALLGDLVTTIYGLEIGLREMNPVVASILADYGIAGLVALKLFAVSWVVAIWSVLGRRYGLAAVVGLAIPQSIAVVINVITILAA